MTRRADGDYAPPGDGEGDAGDEQGARRERASKEETDDCGADAPD